jgi:nucleoside-diphosphate-sugar epimerase
MKKILITEITGFIGFHFVNQLISDGWNVVDLSMQLGDVFRTYINTQN